MKRRIEITVESERITLVRRRRATDATLWCAACGAQSLMLGIDAAAALAGMTSMNVFRLAEAGHLHWQETQAGSLLVCRNSLLRNRRELPSSSGDEP